jgi:SAM-dependent methyltransferase
MSAVDADLSQLTFIDLGSGKGRALMLARQYPFKELIGVEFSGRLVEIARANGIETIHADATEYDLPPVPTLLFLYNPFGRETMDKVAERTRASLKASPREFVVLYLNPFQLESWTSNGFSVAHRGPHFAVLRV